MDFEIIETQEAFDEKVKGILEENTKTVTDTVKKQFKGYISPDESAKLNQQIAELTAKNKAFETSSAKMKIAFENGIPFELAEKLSGETEEEIKAVMTHEFADKKLAYIRDLFVFASFTALSFVDIKELTTDDIVEINGEKWILSKRHKTKVNFQVKLLDIPLQIIKRYERFQEDKLVFPNLNYWNICKPLKKMIKECGISKDISFHCTRHGFATLALSKGVPIESVSRVLGHTNITTTQRYAKITTEKIDKDLTMFGNRLNQSFSEISVAM